VRQWKLLIERASSLKRNCKLIVFTPFLDAKDRELNQEPRQLRRSPTGPGREHLRNQNNSRLEQAIPLSPR
jgi:hypothetical protein